MDIIGKGEGGVITFSEATDLIEVRMDREDWDKVVRALERYADCTTIILLDDDPSDDEARFYADSIQDVVYSL